MRKHKHTQQPRAQAQQHGAQKQYIAPHYQYPQRQASCGGETPRDGN